ncbi:MAG: glycerate kinase [Anaerolineales bacterium]|nr:glycerate kinase [Anaerolineales bacterium]
MFKAEQFATQSLQNARILRILAAAFNAVDPSIAVKKYLDERPLPTNQRTFALGLGKAAIKMTQALADSTSLTGTLVITKHAAPLKLQPATVILGNHPIPGRESVKAGQAALKFVSQLTEDDLLICLISGGGSALMALPVIPLEELQTLTQALLASGANIHEINTIRRHLDLLKGGGLAQQANGAQIVSLILSDVVGDSIQAIASGPTAPDESTLEDVISILKKYSIENNFKEKFRETAKSNDKVFHNVQNHIIASNSIALKAGQMQAKAEGFATKIINAELQGEARDAGKQMALLLKEALQKQTRPFCLLAGGETTVTLTGNGTGGRNQEVALGAVNELSGMENVLLISIATDGEDGPTDAAGAVATNATLQRAKALQLNVEDYLAQHNAYSFFNQLEDLIKTGVSGTNVNDLIAIFAL